MLRIDLSRSEYWVAFAITGVMAIPPCGLGLGPDLYLLPVKNDAADGTGPLCKAVEESFASFGILDHKPLTLGTVKVILIPMRDVSEYGVKVALMVADMALSIFNKKVFSSRARLVEWHRKDGVAVGAILTGGKLSPIASKSKSAGPALIQAPDADAWDTFLHQTLTNTLSPLGIALRKCMEWEREAQQTANITHRFAFLWIALESMLPREEKDGPGCGKRFSILTGSPSGYYSNILRKDEGKKSFLQDYTNPDGKQWRNALEEMYRYRCEILHEGGTEFSSDTMDPLKVDWYGKLAGALCVRITGLAIGALGSEVKTVEDFWDEFVPGYLYSADNHWFTNGMFFYEHLIRHDWSSGVYSDLFD